MWYWTSKIARSKDFIWDLVQESFPDAVISAPPNGRFSHISLLSQQLEDVQELQQQFGGEIVEYSMEDLLASQKQEVKNIAIRSKLLLTTSDDAQYVQQLKQQHPQRNVLSIPAELAFGTGDHGTTRKCLINMCDLVKGWKDWSMLDVGCGTGVLALAASCLGAKRVAGFDFDEIAVKVAKRNAVSNELPQVQFFQADVFEWPDDGERYNLVVANLFASVLEQAFARLCTCMAPGAYLMISGILNTQWPQVLQAAEQQGLKLVKYGRMGKWSTGLLQQG